MNARLRIALLATAMILLNACGGGGPAPVAGDDAAQAALAAALRSDTRLPLVREKARQLVARGFSAGTVYTAVFIRDLNTFTELAVQTRGAAAVRDQLEGFLALQGPNGSIPDGINMEDGTWFKGTAETDQESSLVQAIARYVAASGDRGFLLRPVQGVPVIERLERAVNFVYVNRFSAAHGLVWGATRADWGDVQPEDVPGGDFNELSHPSISIYDNAMLALALLKMQELAPAAGRDASLWAARHGALRAAVRKHLWTGTQFIPHLYLEKGSPFPADFDEARMYFQGGTAVAIQAGLLEPPEVRLSFARMIRNKIDSGSGSVGVTLYPAYPAGFFANTEWMGAEYFYQNGGDWPWFGARIIQQMVAYGEVRMAYDELSPMLERVLRDDAFYEWYTRDGQPRGSRDYRGSAGQIAEAIDMLLAWAASH